MDDPGPQREIWQWNGAQSHSTSGARSHFSSSMGRWISWHRLHQRLVSESWTWPADRPRGADRRRIRGYAGAGDGSRHPSCDACRSEGYPARP